MTTQAWMIAATLGWIVLVTLSTSVMILFREKKPK